MNATRPVLVVEGDDILQQVMSALLDDLGYPPLVVADVPAALHALEHSRPCLVLLDMDQPQDHVEALVREIKPPHGDQVPIIIVGPHYEAASLARSVGADGILEKPFSIDRFDSLVAQLAGS